MGSAALAAGDSRVARRWFRRVGRDHPGSAWEDESWLDSATRRRRSAATAKRGLGTCALSRHRPSGSRVGHISDGRARTLQRLQRMAWAAGAGGARDRGLLRAPAAGARGGSLFPPRRASCCRARGAGAPLDTRRSRAAAAVLHALRRRRVVVAAERRPPAGASAGRAAGSRTRSSASWPWHASRMSRCTGPT